MTSTQPKHTHSLFLLIAHMQAGRPITIEGRHGLINGISREDGSGKSWNITMDVNGVSTTFWIKAI